LLNIIIVWLAQDDNQQKSEGGEMQKKNLIASMALAGFAGFAQAATVNVCGPTICYEYDDAQPAIELFGQPELIGDALRFLPVNFIAASSDGEGINFTTATFQISRVYSVDGQGIIDVSVSEIGDYEIVNGGAVSADLYLLATSNLNISDMATATAAFDASGASGGLQEWAIDAMLNPVEAFSGGANDFALQIQNFLTAATGGNGELAWIQKKFLLEVAVIPVPAAVWLFASALGLLGWVRRQRGISAA